MAELVDGNNLMGRLGGGTRDGLVKELADLARLKRKRFTLVFDGPPEAGRSKVQPLGDLTIVYAAPRTADEEIVRRIQEARDPKGLTVITDDRSLASAVSACGARCVGVEEFRRGASTAMQRRATAAPERKTVPAVSVKDWEQWFADPKNRSSR
ncbi:MAG: NYN domain-containing protein [Thermoanaerobaculia bacterium]